MAEEVQYEVLVGHDFVPRGKKGEARKEPGATVLHSEYPKGANVKALLEQGVIRAKGDS